MELAGLVGEAYSQGEFEYRVVGGLAACLYAEKKESDAGRLTKDTNNFRMRDQMHLNEAGLITPEAETGLSGLLRERLAQVRAHD
jgi:hypothetical protein